MRIKHFVGASDFFCRRGAEAGGWVGFVLLDFRSRSERSARSASSSEGGGRAGDGGGMGDGGWGMDGAGSGCYSITVCRGGLVKDHA